MEKAESRRHTRNYESEDFVKKWKEQIEGNKDPGKLVECLAAWMRDLKTWGENVRDDIIRLESAVRMAAPGEPGDPPPAPRKS